MISNLVKSLELLKQKIKQYKCMFNIEHYVDKGLCKIYDNCSGFMLKNKDNIEILTVIICSYFGELRCVYFCFDLYDETIEDIKFLIEDLELPDWHYDVNYNSDNIYDIRPRYFMHYNDSDLPIMHIYENENDSYSAIKNNCFYTDGEYVLYITGLRSNNINESDIAVNSNIVAVVSDDVTILDRIPTIRYVFVYKNYEDYECWSRNGIEDISLCDYAICIAN